MSWASCGALVVGGNQSAHRDFAEVLARLGWQGFPSLPDAFVTEAEENADLSPALARGLKSADRGVSAPFDAVAIKFFSPSHE